MCRTGRCTWVDNIVIFVVNELIMLKFSECASYFQGQSFLTEAFQLLTARRLDFVT